jgi:hypothetical protein
VNGILPLIIVALVLYFLLSKKGGLGCCGGHHEHRPGQQSKPNSGERFSEPAKELIIDLKKDDYKVKSIENERS